MLNSFVTVATSDTAVALKVIASLTKRKKAQYKIDRITPKSVRFAVIY